MDFEKSGVGVLKMPDYQKSKISAPYLTKCSLTALLKPRWGLANLPLCDQAWVVDLVELFDVKKYNQIGSPFGLERLHLQSSATRRPTAVRAEISKSRV